MNWDILKNPYKITDAWKVRPFIIFVFIGLLHLALTLVPMFPVLSLLILFAPIDLPPKTGHSA